MTSDLSMQMVKYQHKLRDKDWRPVQNTPAFTLHQIPTILVIFLIVQWHLQMMFSSVSQTVSHTVFPSLEYCSPAVRLTSNHDFTTLRNTYQLKHSQDKSTTWRPQSFCNKTEAKSNSIISSEPSGTSILVTLED